MIPASYILASHRVTANFSSITSNSHSQGASLAMYALPTADDMFSKAVDDKKDLRGLLQRIGVSASRVYDLTQQKFEAEGLLNLP